MDEGKTYVNVKVAKTGPQSPSNDGATSTYAELNFPKEEPLIAGPKVPPTASGPGEQPITAQTAGLNSTYSELIFRKEEPRINEDEDPPISSGHGELSTTAQTVAQEEKSEVKIGNRPYRLICLLGVVTVALIVTVAGLSIHVSQIPQSQIRCEQEEYREMNRTLRQCQRQVNELNSTLEFTISENSHLNLSQRICLKNLTALNSNLFDLKQMHSDLHHQFTEMETKYRSVNATKAQICKLLTSKREQTCSENWVKNKDRCYYVSTFKTSLYKAIQECSNRDSWLLEINSRDETSFVSRNILSRSSLYWIGKCEDRNVGFRLLHKVSSETSACCQCDPTAAIRRNPCDREQRFICEKSATVFPDIPEQIQDLCGQPLE